MKQVEISIFDFLDEAQVDGLVLGFIQSETEKQVAETGKMTGVTEAEVDNFLSICVSHFLITNMIEMAAREEIKIGVKDEDLWFQAKEGA